jgi:general secretion pathway protein F
LYAYKGVGANGKPQTGVKDAESPKALRQLLRKEGVVVTWYDIKKGKTKALGAGSGINRDVDFKDIFTRIKKTEIAAFTRQLATLLKSGIPLSESLAALFEQADNVKFKSVLQSVRTAVNEGSSLGDALRTHPHVFTHLYCSMVKAGETAGNLDEVLNRLAEFMESGEKLKAKVQGAMIYPIIMIIIGTVIMGVLLVFVIPQVTQVFADQDMELPIHTKLLVGLADAVANYWWLMFAALGLSVYGFRAWIRSQEGKKTWHAFLLRAWVVGPLLRQVAISRFARTVGTMLESGVPMLQTLDIAKEVLGNVILEREVAVARIAVTEGESLAAALARSGKFPPTIIKMIAVGERAGTLEQMLLSVSDAYDSEVELKLDRFTAILEPLMLVVMGGAVAFMIFSILTPLLDMQKNMGTF